MSGLEKVRSLAAIGVLSVLVCGCGPPNSVRAFDPSLIRQVGQGSTTLAVFYADVVAQVTAARSVAVGPGTDPATANLFDGRLEKLSVQDIVRITKANRASHDRFATLLAGLDADIARVEGLQVNASAYRGLSAATRRFIALWNGYLSTTAQTVHGIERAMQQMEPAFNDLQAILRAAYATTKTRSGAQFQQVRINSLKDIVRRGNGAQSAVKQLAGANSASDHRFYHAVTANHDGLAVIQKVVRDYPNGWLAKEFVWPS